MICMYKSIKTHLDHVLEKRADEMSYPHLVTNMYKEVYNIPIYKYNFSIYQTKLLLSNTHPILSIITMVGDKNKLVEDYPHIPYGIMPVIDYLSYINIIDKSIVDNGITKSTIARYILQVYNMFKYIASADPLYMNIKAAKQNPYISTLRLLQVYFSFYHIKNITNLESSNIFSNILRRDFGISLEDGYKIIDFLNGRNYNSSYANLSFEDIYKTMTLNNSIRYFYV